MRWIWIDRFTEFESGVRAKAVKNVTLAEEHLHDHFPGFPVMPASLITEGLAQTAGILVGECRQFKHVVILAKIPKITFHGWASPGDTLTYVATLQDINDMGGVTECTAHVGDRLVAEAEIMFAHVTQSADQNIDQKNFVFTMKLLGVMDIGKAGTAPAVAAP